MTKISKNASKKLIQAAKAAETQFNLFNQYYRSQYGHNRWEELVISLRKPINYVAMLNQYADRDFASRLLSIPTKDTFPYLPERLKEIYIHKSNIVNTSTNEIEKETNMSPNIQIDEEIVPHVWPSPSQETSLDPKGLCCYYPLDAASLFPVELLDIQPHHSVIDFCAAPGGKSLAILQKLALTPTSLGHLYCNDVSLDRRIRLKHVIRNYLPTELQDHVHILAGDASSKPWKDQFGERQFDRILVDAPCSSERHVLQNPSEISRWAPGRSKANAERQFSLLWNAVQLCKISGLVVYSTCSLSSLENDFIIEKLLKKITKRKQYSYYKIEVVPITITQVPFGEATQYGWHILPDKSYGWGPIYLSVIRKLANEPKTSAEEEDDKDEEDNDSYNDDKKEKELP